MGASVRATKNMQSCNSGAQLFLIRLVIAYKTNYPQF